MNDFMENHTFLLCLCLSFLLFTIFVICFFLFAWKFKKRTLKKNLKSVREVNHTTTSVIVSAQKKAITITSRDISAIAGGDVLTTQLDLARAYIETGRKQLAKKILHFVMLQGTEAQQAEADRLLKLI